MKYGVRILAAASWSLLASWPVLPQTLNVDTSPRVFLDSSVGSETSLGYKFPSTNFGPSVEIPIARHLEVQARAEYSPDKKFLTNDGNSFAAGVSALAWTTTRVGIVADLDHSWLWTSQFNKSQWHPAIGAVIRNDLLGPGRLYVKYLMPAGCVWATAVNPCTIQSNRLQGPEVQQEVQLVSHLRMALGMGVFHFCDQGNPSEPQARRTCHLALTTLATVRIEFHSRTQPGLSTHELEYY